MIDRWAPFTDAELLALVGPLDQVEARAPLARLDAGAVEALNVPQLVRFTRAELDTIQGMGARALETIELALLVHGYTLQLPECDDHA
ncbi:MAG: hypothetical protein M3Q31_05470 [Actinomycetota bacterium]|nr:hypothetical protein [Actinomycetota bacterium]